MAIANLIIYFFVPAYIFYYCAYKKAGTCLLALYLCLKPIDLAIKGCLFIFLPFPFNMCILVPACLISIFLYMLNWKLRKINKKLQLNAIYPEEYELEINVLSNVTSKEDLQTAYASLMRKWPQFEKYSTHLYKQHLSNLQLHMKETLG